MSWYTSKVIPKGSDVRAEIFTMAPGPGNDHVALERDEAFRAAQEAAIQLVESKMFGDPTKFGFVVSLSGHTNKNHEPDPGWSNDCVSVSVTQLNAE